MHDHFQYTIHTHSYSSSSFFFSCCSTSMLSLRTAITLTVAQMCVCAQIHIWQGFSQDIPRRAGKYNAAILYYSDDLFTRPYQQPLHKSKREKTFLCNQSFSLSFFLIHYNSNFQVFVLICQFHPIQQLTFAKTRPIL